MTSKHTNSGGVRVDDLCSRVAEDREVQLVAYNLRVDGVHRHFPGSITTVAIIENKCGRLRQGRVDKEEEEDEKTPRERVGWRRGRGDHRCRRRARGGVGGAVFINGGLGRRASVLPSCVSSNTYHATHQLSPQLTTAHRPARLRSQQPGESAISEEGIIHVCLIQQGCSTITRCCHTIHGTARPFIKIAATSSASRANVNTLMLSSIR